MEPTVRFRHLQYIYGMVPLIRLAHRKEAQSLALDVAGSAWRGMARVSSREDAHVTPAGGCGDGNGAA